MTRQHEFKKETQKVFKVLDMDRTDSVSFIHFDPVAALDLAELQKWSMEHWGGIQNAFKALDKDRNGQLSTKEFLAACSQYGFANPRAAKTLFRLLDHDESGTLSAHEVLAIDKWKYPPWLTADPDHEAATAFKQMLMKKFEQNPIRAWRRVLDKKAVMRVSWDTFEIAGRSYGMSRDNLAKIWKALDDNMSGWLSLNEIWPEAYTLLYSFVKFCQSEYGSVYKAFLKLDDNGNGRLSHSEFRTAATACNFSEADSDLLFEGLDWQNDGRVEAGEVAFLDKWYMERDAKEEQIWNKLADALRRQSKDVEDQRRLKENEQSNEIANGAAQPSSSPS
eukprot:gnl/MRDRNA2_/MRDRNA2_251447_c0_seq1.p1 gnl/MRDRNA2_/MRDRNA2_251447_c0~~gnl/MRDRNA2_/MRDRNA2_251447_c0_seq1.p1  ORF type:complete len:360 (-),score=75.88 gnl/MRDRNA2_/MRDRNA2_251447_c0_seq1:179-1183(-)